MNLSVKELLSRWPAVTKAAPSGWPADFAAVIAVQSRRRGWKPSPKQMELMQRMTTVLLSPRREGKQ
ncbi:hypothetical protein [Aliiruegeria lutimaris]|uniref:Uncharacterized protein n=1 Tax=Aliiruegeria lutimaris TaxID=571298 RepID=A0A1G9MFB7_9RHOB|nr:hypothetical protein [Aliiruegeria lutimaris]SDL72365.1 hypothetical protein SAMN04488026_11094 [Aliiruegeria lutimaris]